MNTQLCLLIFATVVIGCITTGCKEEEKPVGEPQATEAQPPATYSSFPDNFNYPVAKNDIDGWIQSNQMDSIRSHGWYLWAGINQPGRDSMPVWRTWFSVSQAFDPDTTHTVSASAEAIQAKVQTAIVPTLGMFRLTGSLAGTTVVPQYNNWECGAGDNGELANNGDIMIAGVLYNWEAYNHIRKNKLYLQTSLQKYLTNPGQAPAGSIPQFPEKSIVLKHMYWSVRGDSLSTLPVFFDNPTKYGNKTYNGYEVWPDAVAINPNLVNVAQPGATAEVKLLYNVGNYPTKTYKAQVVSIEDFYYRQIAQEEWSRMTSTDQCIINHAFNWAYGRDFQSGDYMVSLAMHIITKEIHDWTMQSLWWNSKPEAGPYAQNRPSALPAGPWQHYLMTTAYSMVNPDDSPLIAYNPYIELVVPEEFRIVSNCQNCHTRGAFPGKQNAIVHPVGQNPVVLVGDSAYYNAEQQGYIPESDTIFTNLVRTDFQWAIPDRASPQATSAP